MMSFADEKEVDSYLTYIENTLERVGKSPTDAQTMVLKQTLPQLHGILEENLTSGERTRVENVIRRTEQAVRKRQGEEVEDERPKKKSEKATAASRKRKSEEEKLEAQKRRKPSASDRKRRSEENQKDNVQKKSKPNAADRKRRAEEEQKGNVEKRQRHADDNHDSDDDDLEAILARKRADGNRGASAFPKPSNYSGIHRKEYTQASLTFPDNFQAKVHRIKKNGRTTVEVNTTRVLSHDDITTEITDKFSKIKLTREEMNPYQQLVSDHGVKVASELWRNRRNYQ